MMFDWITAAEEVSFGEDLALAYDKGFKDLESVSEHKLDTRHRKLVINILNNAKQYKMTHHLNFYSKSKLLNAIKWRLKDLGHESERVDLLLKEIILAIE